jgi:hypothetical protein
LELERKRTGTKKRVIWSSKKELEKNRSELIFRSELKFTLVYTVCISGEVLLSGLESQEKEVFPRKKEKSPF